MKRIAAILALGALASSPSAAASSDRISGPALKAMDRGYGETCSLAMVPVPKGGYYPCIDFGPYRIVKEYGRVTGYVVRDGKQPFLVYRLENGRGGGFVVPGAWEHDMAAQLAIFWNETVERRGGEARLRQQHESERKAAEAFVSGLPTASITTQASASDASPIPAEAGNGGGVVEALTETTTPPAR